MSESGDELTKEQKLEAARKKFEEMKQKKSKKKGKKKQKETTASVETTPVPDETEVEKPEAQKIEGKTGAEAENIHEEPNEDTEMKVHHEASEENEISEPIEQESSSEPLAVESAQNLDKEETLKMAKDSVQESTEDSKEDPIESPQNNAKTVEELSGPEQNGKEDFEEKSAVLSATISKSKEQSSDKIEPLEDILSNTETTQSTFLQNTLESSVKELQNEVKELNSEIAKLKNENSDLRLTNLDLEADLEDTKNDLEEAKNELETQKEQVRKLMQELRIAKTDSGVSAKLTIPQEDEDNFSVVSGSEYLSHPAYNSSFQNLTTFSAHNNVSQDYMDIVDIKERLSQWKGWNMDMKGWRSIGMGPVVDI